MIFPCPICDEVVLGEEHFQRHRCQNEPVEAEMDWLVLSERGSTPIFDVARLDGERLVVALGEAGVAVMGQDGTLLERFPEVCFRLVQGQDEVILWGRDQVSRLSRTGLKFWIRRKLQLAARETRGGLWPVVVENELRLIDLHSRPGESLHRHRRFPLALGLCLGIEQLGWFGKILGGRFCYEVLEYPRLEVLEARRFEWSQNSMPVMAPDRLIWLRGHQAGQYHIADSTFIPPFGLNFEHGPRVEGNYLVIIAKCQLSSLLTVVDLRRPGRQLQILLQDTHYRDLKGEARVQWRIQAENLYTVDSRGRLAVIDLQQGQLQFTHLL